MLSRAECPAILIDAQQHVVASNRRGNELLCAGSFVSVVDGRLACPDDASQRALLAALTAGSAGTDHGHVVLQASKSVAVRRGSARQLGVSLSVFTPFAAGAADGQALVLLTFENVPLASLDLSANVMRCFGLTSAQARVAAELATGKTIKQIAFYLGVSVNTVRHHVKAIFAKTGTNRQVELVQMLGRLAQIETFDDEPARALAAPAAMREAAPETLGGVMTRPAASGEMPAH
ncbi:MAG: helix-turn-helix transcriptional regulator [Burkholderiaceae bacterium]